MEKVAPGESVAKPNRFAGIDAEHARHLDIWVSILTANRVQTTNRNPPITGRSNID